MDRARDSACDASPAGLSPPPATCHQISLSLHIGELLVAYRGPWHFGLLYLQSRSSHSVECVERLFPPSISLRTDPSFTPESRSRVQTCTLSIYPLVHYLPASDLVSHLPSN